MKKRGPPEQRLNIDRPLISIFLPDLRGGGAERVSVDLAHAFALRGYEVEFVLMNAAGEFLAEAQRSFTIVHLGVRKTRFAAWPFARYLSRRRPRAVIAYMWPVTSAAVLGRFMSGHHCTLLLVEQNTISKQYSSWGLSHNLLMRASMATTYRWADAVAAVSRGAADDTAYLSYLPKERVVVLNNPIEKRTYPNSEDIAHADTLWQCPRGERIITVGSLKDQKNHALLVKSFSLLPRRSARLMIVGQGENRPQLDALAVKLGVRDRVIFAGFHHDPSPFYSTADVFALSSDYEGLPTVLIEALSFGLPVVSTDCPSGPSEILENGRWGSLVPLGDAQALAGALDNVLGATPDRQALVRRAADFSPQIVSKRYLDVLRLS